MKFQFYCIIIILLLSIFFINNIHAQNELPYKSLSDFGNDTTAFINYNFIDRAEQYNGKTFEFLIKDLQIPVKHLIFSLTDRGSKVDGLYVCFYNEEENRRLREESTENKPYAILVNWEEIFPFKDLTPLLRERDYYGAINVYKDFQITKIYVFYPRKSEHAKSEAKLRSSGERKEPVRFENGKWVIDIIE